MRIVLDIEADGLTPTTIWCVVTKDIDTNEVHVFKGDDLRERFQVYADKITEVIGHNILSYDLRWIDRLLGVSLYDRIVFDTLVVSRLLNSGREGGHSLDSWGERLLVAKQDFSDWSKLSDEMIEYCKNDVELSHKLYLHFMKTIKRTGNAFVKALDVEHKMQLICDDMTSNGFSFDIEKAAQLDREIETRLDALNKLIEQSFPPRVEVIQLKTKTKEVITPFNPGSAKQVIDRMWEAGWKPVDKTKTHLEAKKQKDKDKLERLKIYGWKVNENNLATLPESAPAGARCLVEHMLLSARRRTLAEWRECYNFETKRIHGRFNPLGTTTQRCSHSNPNMGNIATRKTIKYNAPNLRELAIHYGGEMRSLWVAPEGRWLVGCDLESAHLRIFAHLINDPVFTKSLLEGKKENGTDPHSVNKRVIGDICVDRDRAKTFIFSFLNGAGAGKVSEIFSCSFAEAKEALDKFIEAYPGLQKLKQETIPKDAARGYFVGIDGRCVRADSEHKMIGMYLQNMESVLMKYANVAWRKELEHLGVRFRQVNWIHDEWVTEVEGDGEVGRDVGRIQAASIERVGVQFGLRCPMGGEFKVGKNWLDVH